MKKNMTVIKIGILGSILFQSASAGTFTSEVTGEGQVQNEIVSMGKQILRNKANSTGGTLNESGVQELYNNASSDRQIVNETGLQDLHDNSIARNTVVNKGRLVQSDQSVSKSVNFNGGWHDLYDNARSENESIHTEHAIQVVSGHATVINATIYDQGFQELKDYATATGTTISDTITWKPDGTPVANGQWLKGHSSADNTTLNKGGSQSMLENSTSTNTKVNAGGRQYVMDQSISKGAIVGGTGNVRDTQAQQVVYDDAKAEGTVINAYGVQSARDNTQVLDTTVNTNGQQFIRGSATATNTRINGGKSYVYATAKADKTTVASGYLNGYGTATLQGTSVLGGMFLLEEDANAGDTTVDGDGVFIINTNADSGVTNTVVKGNGTLGIANDKVVIDTLTVSSGKVIFDDAINAFTFQNTTKLNGGTVVVGKDTHAAGYRQISFQKLDGNGGTFLMNTDFANNQADRVVVLSSEGGQSIHSDS